MTDKQQRNDDPGAARAERRALLDPLVPFQRPSAARSVAQLASTLAAYLVTVSVMYWTVGFSIPLTLVLSVLAAGFVVRLFIIQHDCGHGSFFRSALANDRVGWLCSLTTFTPYGNWRRQHANHHAVWNNLDHRNSGVDIYTTCLTVEEYQAMSRRQQLAYRLARHPLVAQLILPPLVFLILYRLPFDTPRAWHLERRSVHLTNLLLAGMIAILVVFEGWSNVAIVQIPIVALASISGVWLFSVQHRFENALWSRQSGWSQIRASLDGCSYLKLPRILQWFTGNIGFHHVHHLLPRVPNYRLEACHNALLAGGSAVQTLRLSDGFRAPGYALWDEVADRMVRFPRRPAAA